MSESPQLSRPVPPARGGSCTPEASWRWGRSDIGPGYSWAESRFDSCTPPPKRLSTASVPIMGRNVKVIRIRHGFLGFGERRKQQRAIARMTRRGWRYVDTVKKWGGYDLTFTRD